MTLNCARSAPRNWRAVRPPRSLTAAVVGEDLHLIVGKGDRDERVRSGLVGGRTGAVRQLRARARRARRSMMAVGDVERRNPAETRRRAARVLETRPPDRVADAVGRGEVVQRLAAVDLPRQRVDRAIGAIGQKHHAGLRPKLDDVARAIVFLVAARALVLLDDVRLVLVEREAAGDAGLLVRAHAQSVQVQRRGLVEHERRALAQRREIRPRLFVHLRRVRIGAGRKIDLRPRDVQKTERIAGGELARFVGGDDVVGHRRDGSRIAPAPDARPGTDGSKPSDHCNSRMASTESSHDRAH